MKKILLFLLLASPCLASGPKRSFDDPLLNDEFENVYHDIGNVLKGNVRISSVTISTATITNLHGVTDGSSACTGCIGEIIESNASGSNAGTFNVTSISLTAGEWLVLGGANSAAVDTIQLGISINSASYTGTTSGSSHNTSGGGIDAGSSASVSAFRIFNISATTTVYLVATTSPGSRTVDGAISAARIH